MSVGGGASRDTTSERGVQNQELDPWIKSQLAPSIQRAYDLANQPFQAYGGQRVAGFTPTQDFGRQMSMQALGVTSTPRQTQPTLSPGDPARAAQVQRELADEQARLQGIYTNPSMKGQPQPVAGIFRDISNMGGTDVLTPDTPGIPQTPGTPGGAQPDGRSVQPTRLPGQPLSVPGYDESFSFDPNAAAGMGTLNSAVGMTQGALARGPDSIVAPMGTAALGQWQGDTQVAGFGGAQLGAANTYGGAQLGQAATIDPRMMAMAGAGSAGFERFGGAKLGAAALSQGRDINRGDIRDVMGGTAAAGIGQYMNPYENDVVQAALGDVERQRGLAQVQNASRQAGAKAFGNRQDFATAEIDRAATDAAGRTSAELRSRGFETALGASQADQARALQAALSNQGVDASVAGLNQADARTIALANQEAQNTRNLTQGQFEQQAGLSNSSLSAQTSIANAGFQTQAGLANAGFQNQGLFRNQDALNQFGLAQGQMNQQAGLASMEARNQRDLTQGQFQQQAGLATQGEQNAAFRSDSARRDALQGMNLGAQNTYGLANQAASLEAQRANQQAGLQFAGLGLQGGAQLGALAGQQRNFALGNAEIMSGLGAQEQQQQQQALNALYEEFLRAQNDPFLRQQLLNQSLGLLPNVVDTSTSRNGSSTSMGFGFSGSVPGFGGRG